MMFVAFAAVVAYALAAPVVRDPQPDVILATFNGESPSYSWTDLNDPVMGGVSFSRFGVNSTVGAGVWDGECRIVPSLRAPGFCNVETDGLHSFADISNTTHIMLRVRLGEYFNYSGFKFSFAADTLNPQFKSFKADFPAVTTSDWTTVVIPLTSFSNDWSSFTGECSTKDPTGYQHHCCTADHPEVCVKERNLKDISQLGLWAEGVAGKFHMDVAWIGAGRV